MPTIRPGCRWAVIPALMIQMSASSSAAGKRSLARALPSDPELKEKNNSAATAAVANDAIVRNPPGMVQVASSTRTYRYRYLSLPLHDNLPASLSQVCWVSYLHAP